MKNETILDFTGGIIKDLKANIPSIELNDEKIEEIREFVDACRTGSNIEQCESKLLEKLSGYINLANKEVLSTWKDFLIRQGMKSKVSLKYDNEFIGFKLILNELAKDACINVNLYDVDTGTIGGKKYATDDLLAFCIFKCCGMMPIPDGTWVVPIAVLKGEGTDDECSDVEPTLNVKLRRVNKITPEIRKEYHIILLNIIEGIINLPCLTNHNKDITKRFLSLCEMCTGDIEHICNNYFKHFNDCIASDDLILSEYYEICSVAMISQDVDTHAIHDELIESKLCTKLIKMKGMQFTKEVIKGIALLVDLDTKQPPVYDCIMELLKFTDNHTLYDFQFSTNYKNLKSISLYSSKPYRVSMDRLKKSLRIALDYYKTDRNCYVGMSLTVVLELKKLTEPNKSKYELFNEIYEEVFGNKGTVGPSSDSVVDANNKNDVRKMNLFGTEK